MEVEALLENKDIGFIQPGQEVEIKVEGVVHGIVESISNNAIEDERPGLGLPDPPRREQHSCRQPGYPTVTGNGCTRRSENG